ncbi:uncharacterized protein N7484_010906 [Penicillium longicatenatum]|uniref:uncharacterized protein n=1 Tax=Penicillium longicatenatum TaxID=1561947 RepID=UPI0025470B4F|nr:uncharacterized protein N7484_010906 [Penicillium longicatenatum]KAJ5630806.1 hypothetical protein N7484_010906 [Penicillium longicatenatum]
MLSSFCALGLALFVTHSHGHNNPIAIPTPGKHSQPVERDLSSFSIEFSFFPHYAGNRSHPNKFSEHLLENFQQITGVYPRVRVGGTSQDKSNYYPDQEEGIKLTYANPTDDQPSEIKYGPAFFESYHTLGNVKFSHGLNMNQNASLHQLQLAAVEACTSIGPQLDIYELGNEWNFSGDEYRLANYSLLDYVNEWNKKSAFVKAAVQKACPGPFPGFMAPSFVFVDGMTTWTAEELYNLDYDPHDLTKEISFHNYMGVFAPPLAPVSYDLQKTLMNHTNIVDNLALQIQRMNNLAYLGHPYILGETNSIANQGRNGESNVFGDALWVVDFSLWAATNVGTPYPYQTTIIRQLITRGTQNIKRLNFHQGLDYRYASWQPIASEGQPPTTRPPYYGHIMVAASLGHSENIRIVNIPLEEDTESAYGIYNDDKLSKLVVVNLNAFNQSTTTGRPSRKYEFKVPGHYKRATVERLIAPGSDALTNITFGGVSYDYDFKQGRPVTLDWKEERAGIHSNMLQIDVPDSSAVLLSLD